VTRRDHGAGLAAVLEDGVSRTDVDPVPRVCSIHIPSFGRLPETARLRDSHRRHASHARSPRATRATMTSERDGDGVVGRSTGHE
jgi:hypothetical protein